MKMREKSQATRRLLMDAALKVISREGYSAATVDKIVKEAGVSKGLAYYHFKNKEAIANSILVEGIKNLQETFEQCVRDTSSGAEALRSIAGAFVDSIYDNKAFGRFFLNELWQENRVLSPEMRELETQLISFLEAQIVRCQEEGTIRADINPEFEAVALVGMVFTVSVYYLMDTDDDDAHAGGSEESARGLKDKVAQKAAARAGSPAVTRAFPHASEGFSREQFTTTLIDFVHHANL